MRNLEYNTKRPHSTLEDLTPGTSVALTAQSVRLRRKTKNPGTLASPGFSFEDGVAVTYFRMRKRHTIIGANSFHGPVRDGKAWFQAAVAAT